MCSKTILHASRVGNTFVFLDFLTICLSSGAVTKIALGCRSGYSAFEEILKIADQ